MELQFIEEDNINEKIIEERNQEIWEIEKEICDLHEISKSLSLILFEQGENIDISVNKIEEGVENTELAKQYLENAVEYDNNSKKVMKEMAIVIGGISFGALGFIGGPIIGIFTLLSGASVSTGLVLASRFTP